MLTITATGIASAQRIGETVVTIRNGNLRGSLEVLVLPPGTYRVAGMVKEAGVPVAGASVDVVENADIHTLTDASGSYRLYGVAGDVQMRVTKEGVQGSSQPSDCHGKRESGFHARAGVAAGESRRNLHAAAGSRALRVWRNDRRARRRANPQV